MPTPVKLPNSELARLANKPPWYRSLFVQLIAAIVIGVLIGWLWPEFGANLKPLADGFIKLIKMLIAPIIFCTVVIGIAHVGDLKAVGRIGVKALIYFEVVTTFALLFGLLIGNLMKPGAGFNIDPETLANGADAVAAKTGSGELPTPSNSCSTSFRCLSSLPSPKTHSSKSSSSPYCSGSPWPRQARVDHRSCSNS
ncbi:hypothetical protein GCM10020255_064210 [Rhodococcus baikonurensis]